MTDKKRILVIDDDQAILEAMELMLGEEGYQVESSNDESGIDNDRPPDLILLDLLLSGRDGRDVMVKLKSQGQTRDVPIIVFSAHKIDAREILAMGAQGFMPKPFDIEELSDLIKRSIR